MAAKRLQIIQSYKEGLRNLVKEERLSFLAEDPNCRPNGHIFAIVLESEAKRKALEQHLAAQGIAAYLHVGALHTSSFFKGKYKGKELNTGLRFAECLLRLPVYITLEKKLAERIISSIQSFFKT